MSKRTDINLAALRKRLLDRKAELEREDVQTREDRAPVELDQSSVGRLSRMDAMQVQAMAQATHNRRLKEIQRITAALHRMDEGEYGICLMCDEDIPAKRLEFDPATPICVKCMSETEQHHHHNGD